MKHIFTLAGILILLISIPAYKANAQSAAGSTLEWSSIKLTGPSGFIENKGQFIDQHQEPRTGLRYMFMRNGMKVQLMENSISFEMYVLKNEQSFDEATGFSYYSHMDPEDRPYPKFRYESSRIDVEFIGANPKPEMVAEEMIAGHLNYYLAHTPPEGVTRVKQFNTITYKNLYNNIDLVLIAQPYEDSENSIAYDFIVHPGGNVNDIKYRYHGSDDQVLLETGMLETGTKQGKIVEMIPESYLQSTSGVKLMPVNVSFTKSGSVIGFHADAYDVTRSLVIDPLLVWATYCGGDSSEEGRGLTTDSLGNVALIGRSNSTNNIATVGAYQTELAGNVDINVDKYDSAGHRLWGTYYGGEGDDKGRGLVADKLNNYYLGCHTNSLEGCATPGAYRENFAGGTADDALLAYFNGADGYRIFGTYYGGTEEETIRRLCMDNAGNVLMIGYTFSDTGIATPGVFQTQLAGGPDLSLSKWSPDGQLIWGTYLGGAEDEHGRSVAVDKDDNIYVNGSTASKDLGTPGVSRPYHSDKQDFLLGKLTTDAQLGWISYWGGAVEDRGRGVYVDSSSKYVYFMGYTASDTGIATPGAYQETWVEGYDPAGEPYHDIVVMKWTLDGQIVWSTYLGGAKDDRGRAITMIGDNEIYISGSTESSDVIATPDGDNIWGGKGDMYLEIFDSTGFRSYGTYFGGSGDEDNLALAVDRKKQNIYLIGTGSSNNLGTPGTEQPVKAGGDDALLVKIQIHAPALVPIASFSYYNILCNTGGVQFTNLSSNADGYLWDFGDGITSTETSPIHVYASLGDYTVTITATNSVTGDSNIYSSLITVSTEILTATVTPAGPTTFCDGESVWLYANTGPGFTYKWKDGPTFISGATNSSYLATYTGNFKVIITAAEGCSTNSLIVDVFENPEPTASILEGSSIETCEGNFLSLHANTDPDLTYQWLINNTIIPGATANSLTATSSADYAVVETNVYNCHDTSEATVVTINLNPPANIVANGSTTFCEGNSVGLFANGGNGLLYQWQLNASNISGATDAIYYADQAGGYTVNVTDTNDCSSSSAPVTVIVNPLPPVFLGADTTVCDTINFVLDAGSGFNAYLWSTGATTQTITVSGTDDYWATVKDANDCTGTDTIHVEVTICTGINTLGHAYNINLFPNPSNGNFIVSFSNPNGEKVNIQLENIVGQKVMHIYDGQTGKQFTKEISAFALPSAVYYLKVVVGNEMITKKLIIQR